MGVGAGVGRGNDGVVELVLGTGDVALGLDARRGSGIEGGVGRRQLLLGDGEVAGQAVSDGGRPSARELVQLDRRPPAVASAGAGCLSSVEQAVAHTCAICD